MLEERNVENTIENDVQHVFIIGAKSIGQYGGYETFVDRLLNEHEGKRNIQYHVACKANGDGCMVETKLSDIEVLKKNSDGIVTEFKYKGAHVFKIKCPSIGPAVAIYYDRAALKYSINYCIENDIQNPVFYVLTCRIGLFINGLQKKIKKIGGRYYLNPDGHEWKRAKWSPIVRKYWKWSEKKMVNCADLVVCDSVNIERYIQEEYHIENTTFIAYGAEIVPSVLADDSPIFREWLEKNKLEIDNYYLVVGRFVPENNYETMLREFMKSKTNRDFVLVTNVNDKFLSELENSIHWKQDSRIKFAGTVYDKELLKKIRECAYGYFHGHEVGGTNPSLLESLATTKLNLLYDVGFNREVAEDSALYWNKEPGNLASLIESADALATEQINEMGNRAKKRITDCYSWEIIGLKYENIFNHVPGNEDLL